MGRRSDDVQAWPTNREGMESGVVVRQDGRSGTARLPSEGITQDCRERAFAGNVVAPHRQHLRAMCEGA